MSDTRGRILDAAARLFRHQGYPGTGLKQIAAESQAPFGSIYHFFPGGKEQLTEQVVRTTGPEYMKMVLALLDSEPDPVTALGNAFALAAEHLAESDYADACPIATIALEVASTNEKLRTATEDVFAEWLAEGTAWFAGFIPDREQAATLANAMICLLEGAFVLSRASRSPEPIHAAGRSITALTRAAIGG